MTNHVLIVGSEGGLGKELVRLWQQRDFQVFGLDLQKTSHSSCNKYRSFDLLKDDPLELLKIFQEKNIFFQQVIICAAQGYYGSFTEQKNIENLVRVNFTAPVALIKELASVLNEKTKILFIGSVASHMPTPEYEVYSATKLALESFVRSWRWEVGERFDVKIYLPGAMKTSFHERVGFSPSEKLKKKFAEPRTVAHKIWKFSQSRSACRVLLSSQNGSSKVLATP